MIGSVHNVDENFYKELLGENLTPSLTIPTYLDEYQDATFTVPVRYAKESAYDRSENQMISYPMISVQNFNPEIEEEMVNVHYKDRLSGFRDTNNDGVADEASLFPAGIPLRCRYEIGIASKSEKEWDAMRHHFMKHYGFKNTSSFVFNKIIVPSDDSLQEDVIIGDGVYYVVDFVDVPRTDGVFETNVVFVLSPWVDIKDPVVYDLYQTINVRFKIV